VKGVLTEPQEVILRRERVALRELETALQRCEAASGDMETLEQSIRQLDELFLLVVVGEFNAGKSTFINALLGKTQLPEGVTPTTMRIHRLRFGQEESRELVEGGIEELTAPIDLLRQVTIVDTPGTNALDRRHEAITDEYVPRADLVLFVTSADRPLTESERAFMERIRQWGKKLVLVVNKIDILQTAAEIDEVRRFVTQGCITVLGFEPRVFTLSARRALAHKLEGDRPADPGFAALEEYLVDTLDEAERVRLKLANPLGVGGRLVQTYIDGTDGRLDLLRADFTTLDDIERQLDLYSEDMGREFRFRLSDVDTILHEFELRGQEYFDDTLRLPRAFDLMNKARIKSEFEKKVVGDAPQQIESKVQEIIDWMVSSELRQWRAVSRSIEARRTRHSDRLVGEIGTFDLDRDQLLETVGRAARRTVDGYDQGAEAVRMADSVQTAVAGAALMEVSALGLGAIVTAMATTQLADITGLLAAGTLAVLGLLVLPTKRRRAKRELADKIQDLRDRLMRTLTGQFDQELARSVHRIRDAVSPYTRFVRAERQRLETIHRDLTAAQDALIALHGELDEL
jgi:small GTP-binding protein